MTGFRGSVAGAAGLGLVAYAVASWRLADLAGRRNASLAALVLVAIVGAVVAIGCALVERFAGGAGGRAGAAPWRRTAAACGAAAWSAVALAALEGGLLAFRPPGVWTALVALDALFAVAVATAYASLLRVLRPLRPYAWGYAVVGPVWLGALLAVGVWAFRTDRAAVVPWVAALAAAAAPGLAARVAHIRPELSWGDTPRRAAYWPGAAASVAVAAGGGAILLRDAFAEVDLRAPTLLLCATALSVGVGRALARRSRLIAISGVALALALAVRTDRLVGRQDLRVVLLRDTTAAGLALRALRALGDPDRDGYAAWFGGDDCAPFERARHPFARERAGNGIDEDCSGADLGRRADAGEESAPANEIRPGDADENAGPPPDMVLVTIDTLRAREVGCLGGPGDATPRLDGLAAGGGVFERAYAVSPVTHRALPSLLVGLLPSDMPEALRGNPQRIGDQRTTLAEALTARGYEVQAVITRAFLERHNVDQGVGTIVDHSGTSAERIDAVRTGAALDLVRRWSPTPKLLIVHYYEAHGPHRVPRDERARDGSEIEAYRAEIRRVDRHLGILLDGIRASERGARSVIVVTGDHGEELYEHGHHFHAQALYEESVHVPLVVAGPGVRPGRVRTPVDQMDLARTLAALGGVARFGRGRDLRPALRGEPVPERPIVLELYPMRTNTLAQVGVVDRSRKLIVDLRENLYEYYDLATDPLERVNIYDDQRERASDLRQRALAHIERALAR